MVIGITGGIGCGKSTVAGLFEVKGYSRMDSDEIIRNQLLVSPEVRIAHVERFGPEVLTGEHVISRGYLASRIFASDEERLWLEDYLLPKLFLIWRKSLAGNLQQNWVFEVPLLFEKQLENWFDFTVCVATTAENQLVRLEKRGMTRAHAELRISKQLPLARKVELADFVIGNDGTPDFLRLQVDALAGRFASCA